MINLKAALTSDILTGLKAAQESGALPSAGSVSDIEINHPQRDGQGDYASSVGLKIAPQVKKKPMDVVEIIAEHMPKKEYLGKLEAVAPGFLNMWISDEWLKARVDDIVEEDICADCNVGQGKTINLEFISANPTGPLTLGNARTAFSADTLANVLECAGYNVTREYYVNDAGGQIRRLGESVLRRALQAAGHEVEFAEDLYQGEYISEVAATLAERWKENEGKEFDPTDLEDEEFLEKISVEAMEQMLAIIKKSIHDDLNIHFDIWASERAVRKSGIIERALEALREKNLTYEKEGAELLKTTEFGDDQDRVLVKSDKEYAYIAPDIGYHLGKYERKFDEIFTFLGADHQGHVPKLTAALKALGLDTEQLHLVVAQWLNLVKDGKEFTTSKRKGELYGPQDLIAEIGYDAARYFMIQHALSTHMTLDLDVASERSERNPVYYVQYAYVRLQSIIRKAKEQGIVEKVGDPDVEQGQLSLHDPSEFQLIKRLFELPEVVEGIASSSEVHQLPHYAYDLARDIHSFYKQAPVLGVDDPQVQRSRLALVLAAKKVLGETLDLLGISKPDVM